MLTAILFSLLLCHAGAIRFTVTPSTFVAAVTPKVTLQCDVADSGSELSQLLLIQLDLQDRGNLVPMVTLTPGTAPKIMESGLEQLLSVDGSINQLSDIASSYLSATYTFPPLDVAGNYTCIVSGLSSSGMLQRYTQTASLTAGALDQIPNFMTAEVVQMRADVEKLKQQRETLLQQAQQLKEEEQNITQELSVVEGEFSALATQMKTLQSQSDQLDSLLANATGHLNHLTNVRPGQLVAFHAAMSEFGARPVSLAMRTPIVFDHVITNQGQGYDPATGVFTVPETGTYLFTASMIAGSGRRYSELAIMLNDQYLQTMQMADDTDYEHSTTTTIAHARAGDRVRCEFTWQEGNPGYVGSTLTSAPYISTFSGYIIW